MRLIRDPLRLAEATAQAAIVLAVVLMPYRSYALDAQRVTVSAGALAALTLAVYALHAVTFDHFRLTGNRRWPGAGVPGTDTSFRTAEAGERVAAAAGTARRT
jgi:hypothetical protein